VVINQPQGKSPTDGTKQGQKDIAYFENAKKKKLWKAVIFC
jgi:hypothetical protein